MGQYIDNFIDNGYEDMDTIIHTMNEQELQEIGVNKRGHRKKIMLNIERLRKMNDNGSNGLFLSAKNDDFSFFRELFKLLFNRIFFKF